MTAHVAVLGAGAFGGALAIALARNGAEVLLWGRDPEVLEHARAARRLPRLPDTPLPESITLTAELADLTGMTLLLAVPMQRLAGLLIRPDFPRAAHLIACCKGLDLTTGEGPSAIMTRAAPMVPNAVLTGPSFAVDIAAGLPTALTLACANAEVGAQLQQRLSTPTLRLYTNTDPIGAELGGALKNVMAIACGLVIGAGLGCSARAALMTRGMVEMSRLSTALGARAETLSGLSGFGDLVLTCTSNASRNYRYGLALGQGMPPDTSATVEGVATARAALDLSRKLHLNMPITEMVAGVLSGQMDVAQATQALLRRDLTKE